MIVGFTGTRTGMTFVQIHELRKILDDYKAVDRKSVHEFHHGDCTGADAQAHDVAKDAGYWVVVHPPTNTDLRAFKIGHCEKPPKAYLERNHDIVNASDILIAAPAGPEKMRGSGTWATVRYARKVGKPFTILERGVL